MESIIRLSDAFSLAVHAAGYLAGLDEDRPASAAEMARALNASEAHLAKVLQRLSRQGVVTSKRGAGGGFVLPEASRELSLLALHEAVDGPLKEGSCLLGKPLCEKGRCKFSGLMESVQQQVRRELATTRIADLEYAPPESVQSPTRPRGRDAIEKP
jgi:Rrf2 family protein